MYIPGAFENDIADTVWFVTQSNSPQPDPSFSCNAEETDTRLWVHVRKTDCTKILVMSPDTDVFIIGLALQSTYQKEVIVQLSAYRARELLLLNLSSLTSALRNDPDLGRLNNSDLPKIVQSLYACTGCLFFCTIGKSTFMRYFYQYAGFISGDTDHAPGSLSNVSLLDHKWKRGFLAFLRLIGVVYFKKHSSGFDIQSPLSLYSKFEDLSIEQQLINGLTILDKQCGIELILKTKCWPPMMP